MRRFILIFIGLVASLGLSACTPGQAIWATFGSGGDARLVDQAHRVAWCESEHKPWVVSPTNDHGLFQINAYYHRTNFERVTGQPWSSVYDPFWNAVYAKHLYDRQGWQPWTCRYAAR